MCMWGCSHGCQIGFKAHGCSVMLLLCRLITVCTILNTLSHLCAILITNIFYQSSYEGCGRELFVTNITVVVTPRFQSHFAVDINEGCYTLWLCGLSR